MNQSNKIFVPAWGTVVAAIYTFVLLFRMGGQYPTRDMALLASISLIELVIIDLLTKAALGIRPVVPRLLALALPAALGAAYVAQIYATWISGGFIPPIAFANGEVIGLISFSGVYVLLGLFFIAFIAHGALRQNRAGSNPATAVAGIAVLAIAYFLMVRDQPLARGIVIARGEAPVSSFIHSLTMYARMNSHVRLDATGLAAARKEFSRRAVYEHGFPQHITESLPERPNVIVVFAEGMSARWMDSYGSKAPGVTPNLDRLADGSLLFTNYYNHTAATFRGLRGQLTSGHQEADGYNAEGTGSGQRDVSQDVTAISRVSVPEILRAHGYRTLFFLSQQEYLNKMIDTLGFDRTLGRDYLFDTYLAKPGKSERPTRLSDKQLFDAMLTELEALPPGKPFFAAAYNFQTHAFLNGDKTYGDGGNEVLNRFHTFDSDIGDFIQRLMASPLHSNTVLVFTSDHSTFPGPVAVQADSRMPLYFVDTIPLLIYWKSVEHRRIDLEGKNSLDLAPSLLSLLSVKAANNLFIGCTFFEQCALDRISNIGPEYILTDRERSYSELQVPGPQQAAFQKGRQAIDRYKSMDVVIETPHSTSTEPVPHVVLANESLAGSFVAPRDGGIRIVGIRIGNYSGISDGTAVLEVCHADSCQEGTAEISGSTDNDFLQFWLPAPLNVATGDEVKYVFKRRDGIKPLAVWSYPARTKGQLTLPDNTKIPREARISLVF